MQNQSNPLHHIVYAHLDLAPEFPVECLWDFVQSDEYISYLHYHNCVEIGYCMEGAGVFMVDRKIHTYSAGDVCIIFPGQPHLAQSAMGSTSKWNFVFFHPEVLLKGMVSTELSFISQLLKSDREMDNILSEALHPEIVNIVKMVFKELRQEDIRYESAVRSMIWGMMVLIGRLRQRGVETVSECRAENIARVGKALEYISNNYMYPIKITSLAKLCNSSVPNFRKLFEKSMGVSPLEYVITTRIQMAATLLGSTEAPVLDISLQVGYLTLSSFNRHFKRIIGVCPREWRRKKGKGPEQQAGMADPLGGVKGLRIDDAAE